MTGVLAVLGLGFILGMRHATDPDHVIAVTTIVTRHRTPRGALWIGGVWGLGHTLTVMVVGGGIIVFGWVIPERIGLSFELGVGIMLILLGLANLKGALRLIGRHASLGTDGQLHSQTHSHGDYVHTHPHEHNPQRHPHRPDQTPLAWLDHRFGTMGLFQVLRPLVVGVVHGLAGSASVALLVLAAIGNVRWGFVYLVLFGAGTIVGMLLVTAAITWPLRFGNQTSNLFAGRVRVAAGVVSIAFGAFLAYHVAVTRGLLTGLP